MKNVTRIDCGWIILKKANEVSHFVYTRLGRSGFEICLYTETPEKPSARFYSTLTEIMRKGEYKDGCFNNTFDNYNLVIFDFDKVPNYAAKDVYDRVLHNAYKHAVVFEKNSKFGKEHQTETSVREALAQIYKDSAKKQDLGEAINLLYNQAHYLNGKEVEVFLEKLMEM